MVSKTSQLDLRIGEVILKSAVSELRNSKLEFMQIKKSLSHIKTPIKMYFF